jgi:hypothetical protein
MSLTQAFHVFAGVSENGINTFLQALFTRRPHYLNYGSPSLVATSTINATSMAAISFPGIPGEFNTRSRSVFPDSTYSLQMRVADRLSPRARINSACIPK